MAELFDEENNLDLPEPNEDGLIQPNEDGLIPLRKMVRVKAHTRKPRSKKEVAPPPDREPTSTFRGTPLGPLGGPPAGYPGEQGPRVNVPSIEQIMESQARQRRAKVPSQPQFARMTPEEKLAYAKQRTDIPGSIRAETPEEAAQTHAISQEQEIYDKWGPGAYAIRKGLFGIASPVVKPVAGMIEGMASIPSQTKALFSGDMDELGRIQQGVQERMEFDPSREIVKEPDPLHLYDVLPSAIETAGQALLLHGGGGEPIYNTKPTAPEGMGSAPRTPKLLGPGEVQVPTPEAPPPTSPAPLQLRQGRTIVGFPPVTKPTLPQRLPPGPNDLARLSPGPMGPMADMGVVTSPQYVKYPSLKSNAEKLEDSQRTLDIIGRNYQAAIDSGFSEDSATARSMKARMDSIARQMEVHQEHLDLENTYDFLPGLREGQSPVLVAPQWLVTALAGGPTAMRDSSGGTIYIEPGGIQILPIHHENSMHSIAKWAPSEQHESDANRALFEAFDEASKEGIPSLAISSREYDQRRMAENRNLIVPHETTHVAQTAASGSLKNLWYLHDHDWALNDPTIRRILKDDPDLGRALSPGGQQRHTAEDVLAVELLPYFMGGESTRFFTSTSEGIEYALRYLQHIAERNGPSALDTFEKVIRIPEGKEDLFPLARSLYEQWREQKINEGSLFQQQAGSSWTGELDLSGQGLQGTIGGRPQPKPSEGFGPSAGGEVSQPPANLPARSEQWSTSDEKSFNIITDRANQAVVYANEDGTFDAYVNGENLGYFQTLEEAKDAGERGLDRVDPSIDSLRRRIPGLAQALEEELYAAAGRQVSEAGLNNEIRNLLQGRGTLGQTEFTDYIRQAFPEEAAQIEYREKQAEDLRTQYEPIAKKKETRVSEAELAKRDREALEAIPTKEEQLQEAEYKRTLDKTRESTRQIDRVYTRIDDLTTDINRLTNERLKTADETQKVDLTNRIQALRDQRAEVTKERRRLEGMAYGEFEGPHDDDMWVANTPPTPEESPKEEELRVVNVKGYGSKGIRLGPGDEAGTVKVQFPDGTVDDFDVGDVTDVKSNKPKVDIVKIKNYTNQATVIGPGPEPGTVTVQFRDGWVDHFPVKDVRTADGKKYKDPRRKVVMSQPPPVTDKYSPNPKAGGGGPPKPPVPPKPGPDEPEEPTPPLWERQVSTGLNKIIAQRFQELLESNEITYDITLPPSKQVYDALLRGDIKDDTVQEVLNEFGLSMEDLADEALGTYSDAGRTLSYLSHIVRRYWMRVEKENPKLADKLIPPRARAKMILDDLENGVLGQTILRRMGGLAKKMVLSDLSIAVYNVMNAVGNRIPLDIVSSGGAAWLRTVMEGEKSFKENVADGVDAAWETMKTSMEVYRAMNPRQVIELIRGGKATEFNRYKEIVVNLEKYFPDIHAKLFQRPMGLDQTKIQEAETRLKTLEQLLPRVRDESTRRDFQTRMDKLRENLDSEMDGFRAGLRGFELPYDVMLQPLQMTEFFIRRPMFVAWLGWGLKQRGIDLPEVLRQTAMTPEEFKNVAPKNRRQFKDIPEEDIKWALERALETTYAYDPSSSPDAPVAERFGARIIQAMNELGPITAVWGPMFAKAAFNGAKALYEYSAMPFFTAAFNKDHPFRRIFRFEEATDPKTGEKYRVDPPSFKDYDKFARAVVGTMLFFTAWGLIKEGFVQEGSKVKTPFKDKRNKPIYWDISRWQPFSNIFILADIADRIQTGNVRDRKVASEMLKAYTGIQRVNAGPDAAETIDNVMEMWNSDDWQTSLGQQTQTWMGRKASIPLTPLVNMRNIWAQFDSDENVKKDLRGQGFWGPSIDKIPWLRQDLPNITYPTEPSPVPLSEVPALAQFGTIQLTPGKNFIGEELARMGVDVTKFLDKDPDPTIDRAQNKTFNAITTLRGIMLKNDPTYLKASDDAKLMRIEEMMMGDDGAVAIAKEAGQEANPREVLRREALREEPGKFARKASGYERFINSAFGRGSKPEPPSKAGTEAIRILPGLPQK